MLRNCGQPLFEWKLEAEVVYLDDESVTPQVRTPMAKGQDETDELAFVGRQFDMSWGNLLAEERHRYTVGEAWLPTVQQQFACPLMEDHAKPVPGGIVLHDEFLVEFR